MSGRGRGGLRNRALACRSSATRSHGSGSRFVSGNVTTPGTRETDLLNPVNTIERVHAIVLSGGSAFGLDAASGVVRFLDERAVGFKVTSHGIPVTVPIVPAAVLIDLGVGGSHKIRPGADCGYRAASEASIASVIEGTVGADGRGLADSRRLLQTEAVQSAPIGGNTTIGVVATNRTLTKVQVTKIAQMAHDGLARTIYPIHTPADGDTIFALSTGTDNGMVDIGRSGALAAQVMADAVLRAVRQATGLPGYPAVRDLVQ